MALLSELQFFLVSIFGSFLPSYSLCSEENSILNYMIYFWRAFYYPPDKTMFLPISLIQNDLTKVAELAG